jgi:hypothetical protein
MSEQAPGATDLLPDQMAPEAASARITELKADPNFKERYFSGEVAARDEFARLHTTAFGKNQPDEMAQRRAMGVDILKQFADLPEKMWDQVRNNGPVHQHEYDEAVRMKDRLFRDKAWVARYLDGGRDEANLMMQTSLILASPVRKND